MKTKLVYFKQGEHYQVGKLTKEKQDFGIIRYMIIQSHRKGAYRTIKLKRDKYERVVW